MVVSKVLLPGLNPTGSNKASRCLVGFRLVIRTETQVKQNTTKPNGVEAKGKRDIGENLSERVVVIKLWSLFGSGFGVMSCKEIHDAEKECSQCAALACHANSQ